MKLNSKFFLDVLLDNPSALPVRAEAQIVAECPDQSVVVSNGIDIEEYANLGHCKIDPLAQPRPSSYQYWGGEVYNDLYTAFEQVVWKVEWRDHFLHVVHLKWDNGCGGDSRDFVVAEQESIALDFILDVERITNAPNNSIQVFANGYWSRSRSLYDSIQHASFEDLILPGELKQNIRDEFKRFLESEDRYNQLAISWRRGALFIGPPGNGKTHCVRALIKELNIPIFYVQSLSHSHYTSEQLWHQVFKRARKQRPCVLVLEDLDSLVDDNNRSFFLNQLDGFEQNHGMIILATTNHPKRIDAAIVDRPSRFDRKYHFNLPTEHERRNYLILWQQKLSNETGWETDEVSPVVSATKGYSFAYLKELVVSSVMQWMRNSNAPFAKIIIDEAKNLKKQMKTDS